MQKGLSRSSIYCLKTTLFFIFQSSKSNLYASSVLWNASVE